VFLRPASQGTGVIAGGAVRAVVESAGIHDILTKCIGSANPHNVVHATLDALRQLKSLDMIASKRRKETAELTVHTGKKTKKVATPAVTP
jgi:small subunit ribosomal protein S5